jgi:predicted RNA-binding protein with RPS1 domain
MSEEILINVTPQETRVALVENGVLQEVHIERTSSRGLVGNIYQGKVVRVLPGMQAAFVDIGQGKAAFLHASDIRPGGEGAATNAQIGELVKEGQAVVVQVVKDPLGTKGARLTTQISLPARYLVYLPESTHIGISQKIGDEATRERLKSLVKDAMLPGETGGYILRTLAETAAEEAMPRSARSSTRTCRLPSARCVTWYARRSRRSASTRARPSSRHATSPSISSRRSPSTSNTTRASGRSSTCIRSRMKSRKPCRRKYCSRAAATWSSTRPRR